MLEPVTPLVEGWPLEAICDHLEAVTHGELTRLLINVPPGFMKPNSIDSMVVTRRGRLRLGDVLIGDQILTHRGRYRGIKAVHSQGELPLLEVLTEHGRSNKTAPDHPYLTTRGWIRADKLVAGDVLAAVSPAEEGMFDQVTAEEARLMGYLVGDGGVTHSPVFTNANEEVLADFERCAKALGIETARRAKTPSGVVRNATAWAIGLSGALPWLKKHELWQKDSYTKRIPPAVLSSSRAVIANFIGAYWSCDGQIVVRHTGERGSIYVANAVTVGALLASDLQHALLRLGINARVRIRSRKLETKRQPGGLYVYYHVQTCSHQDTVLFKDLPGLCHQKNSVLQQLTLQRFVQGPLFEDEVIEIKDAGVGECRCLTVEDDHSFTAGDLAVHNSLLTNVFWPAWEWGPMGKPHLRYVTFSYASSLTERDNGRFRDLLRSADFQELWGSRFKLTEEGKIKVANNKTGWKLASSVGGVGTGERGDRVLLDDPHNVKDAESEVVRTETVRWFRESMSNRLNDMEKSAIVIIMQRVHEDDVSGAILAAGMDYSHLMLPMHYDASRHCSTDIGWSDPRQDDGELAWPERFSPAVVERMGNDLGPYATAGQYEQSPVPRGGGIFLREWWQLWDSPDGKFPVFELLLASLDSAFTEKEQNDPSGLTVWGLFTDSATGRRRIMLVHAWRKHLQFSGPRIAMEPGENPALYRQRTMSTWGLIEWVADTCRRFKVDKLLIEAKASGISAAQELRNRYNREDWSVQLCQVSGDKVARALGVQATFAQLLVYAPARDWAEMTIDECAVFPKGKYKDLTDSTTQAIKYLRDTGMANTDEETHAAEMEGVMHRPRRKALYPI